MAKPVKIVVIGGGSSYTPELIEGFIMRYKQLPIAEIVLVDIEEGQWKLDIIEALAIRMVKHAKLPIKITATLNRREALLQADFVITQIRVGQLDARLLDETIPAHYGELGQETVGAGGLFKALRTIPVIFEIIEDMKELCEKAWLINFSNPAGMVAEAVFRYAEFDRFIGVCNVPVHMNHHFADLLNVKANQLVPVFAGLNHLSYVLQLIHKKKDRLPEVMHHLSAEMTMKNIDPMQLPPKFLKLLGVVPGPYQKYYYLYDAMLKAFLEQAAKQETRASVVKKVEAELFEQYQNPSLYTKPAALEQRGGAFYSDAACSIIEAIHNDLRNYHVVITQNNGHIDDLPKGCAIEITCRMTKDGPVPMHIGRLPLSVRGLVQTMKVYEEMVADAIFERHLDKARLALCLHPLTRSVTTMETVFHELLKAHKPYLHYYEENLT